MELKNMPKTLLHIQLGGSISFPTLEKMSGLSKEEIVNKFHLNNKEETSNNYFSFMNFCNDLLQTKENLYLASKDLVDNLVNDNVIYVEVRLAPILYMEKGLYFDDIITSVLSGLNSNPKIKVNLILCMLRGATQYMNMETLKYTLKYLDHGVCALDIIGDDDLYPLYEYRDLFRLATLEKIPFAIHAGDNKADDIYEALALHTKRLNSGLKAVADMDLLRLVYYKRTMLEICPTSNVLKKSVSELGLHPINFFLRNNFMISVNSNNMTFEDASLTKEYEDLNRVFGFTIDDFKKLNLNAIESSFLKPEEKNKYKNYFI